MRTLSADWMANTSKPESDFQSLQHGGEENRGNIFYPRPVAPTTAQVSLYVNCFVQLVFSNQGHKAFGAYLHPYQHVS